MSADDKILPGHLITEPSQVSSIHIPEGKVVILHSKFGIEGVFDSGIIMEVFIMNLLKLAAYRDEKLSFDVHELNPAL